MTDPRYHLNGGMSAIGTKRTWAGALHMSAFGGKADPHRKMSANEKCMLTNGNPTGVLR